MTDILDKRDGDILDKQDGDILDKRDMEQKHKTHAHTHV